MSRSSPPAAGAASTPGFRGRRGAATERRDLWTTERDVDNSANANEGPTGGGPLMYFGFDVGGVLLSHTLSSAVPSALEGLASGFGMGPGVPPPLKPPTTLFKTHFRPLRPPQRVWWCAQGHTVDASLTSFLCRSL